MNIRRDMVFSGVWAAVVLAVFWLGGTRITAPNTARARAKQTGRNVARSRAAKLLRQRWNGLSRFRRSPRGCVYLMELHRLEERLAPTRFDKMLRRGASWRNLHPLVDFALGRLTVERLARRGKYRQAVQRASRLGFVSRAAVVGAFSENGTARLDTVYGPEQQDGVVWNARYETTRAKLRWRLLSSTQWDGALRPSHILRPLGQGVVYVAFGVRVKRSVRAALRVGTAGGYKLWVGRTLVGQRKLRRPVYPDQDAYAVSLQPGSYLIKIKLFSNRGYWPLYFRVTDLKGGSLPGVTSFSGRTAMERAGATMGPPAGPHSKVPFGAKVGTPLNVVETLRKRVIQRPREPQALRELITALLTITPDDPRKGRARARALQLIKLDNSARNYRLLARASHKPMERVAALRAAYKQDPRDPETLILLARQAYERGRLRRAERYVKRCLHAHPHHTRGQILKAELLQARGLGVLARQGLAALQKRVGWRPDLLRLYADTARETEKRKLAADLYRRLLRFDHADPAARRVLLEQALDRLNLKRALTHLRALSAADPHSVSLLLEQTDLLAANGQPRKAVRMVQKRLRKIPADVSLHVALGRYWLGLGKKKRARKAWARALLLRPQSTSLRQRIALLKAAKPDQLVARYAYDAQKVVRAAQKKPLPQDKDGVVLRDRTAIRVHANGMAHRFRHRLVQIVDERGARKHNSWKVTYQPDAQRLRVVAAKVWRADGTTDEAVSEQEYAISDPAVRIYYDLKEREIVFPKLRPGDVIELQMTLTDTADHSPFGAYFGILLPLQETSHKKQVEVIIEGPKDQKYYTNKPRLDHLTFTRRIEGKRQILHWRARDVDGFRAEPSMPGWAEVAAHLHVSTFRSPSAVARWYWDLIKEQYHADASIKKTARRLTAGKRTVAEKVRAVYRFVTRKIRYVSLAFGIHTHKPYSAPQVLARRFGDCKDTAMLLTVLLAQAGIKAHPVLVRTRSGGRVAKKPASIAVFDHAIVYVPALKRFLDGTAEFSGSQDLPYQDQGATALVIDGKNGKMTQVPVLPARQNRMTRKLTVTLKRDGSGGVAEELTLYGGLAAEWRYRFQERSRRRELFEKALSRSFPGAKIRTLNMEGIENTERPVRVVARYRVPHLLRGKGAEKSLSLTRSRSSLVQRLAPLTRRRQIVELDYPFVSEERITLQMESGLKVKELPARRDLTQTIGARKLQFRQRIGQSNNRITLKRNLKVAPLRIPVKAYKRFRRFLAEVDAALAERFVFERQHSGGQATGRTGGRQ